MNDFTKRLGERLRSLRGEATLREFAPQLGLGAKALHRIESGGQNITLETLATICEHLQCSAGDLLDESKDVPKPAISPRKKKTAPVQKRPS